jgi:hypothetical protein
MKRMSLQFRSVHITNSLLHRSSYSLFAEIMFSKLILPVLASFAFLSVKAQLSSFGADVANGGTYFINLGSTAPFSFTGGFSGTLIDLWIEPFWLRVLGSTIVDTVTATMLLTDGTSVSCSSVSTTQSLYESVW